MPTTVTVLNLKGGTGKTNTVVHLAQAFHEAGARVLAVDADPQGSLLRWNERVGFPWDVTASPSGRLHRDLPGFVGDRWSVVVIDTPPTVEERIVDGERKISPRSIGLSAARAADRIVVPLTPSRAEHERMDVVAELLDEARDYEATFAAAVLLVKVKASAASGPAYRASLERGGWRVLRPVVPERESYRQAWGQPLLRAHVQQHTDVAAELLEVTV